MTMTSTPAHKMGRARSFFLFSLSTAVASCAMRSSQCYKDTDTAKEKKEHGNKSF